MFKKILPGLSILLIGIFIFLLYETAEEINKRQTGFAVWIMNWLIVLYSTIGRIGTLILFSLLSAAVTFMIYQKSQQKN